MSERQICLHVKLPDEATAMQLAQFIKRVAFNTLRSYTEHHLTAEQRDELAYRMVAGLNAVGTALRDEGFAPR